MNFRADIRFRYGNVDIIPERNDRKMNQQVQINLAELMELMRDETFEMWEEATLCLTIKDIRKLLLIRFLASQMNVSSLERVAQSLEVRITPKDRSRGAIHILMRILVSYDKPQVQALFTSRLRKVYFGKEDKLTMGEPAFEHLTHNLMYEDMVNGLPEPERTKVMVLATYHYASMMDEQYGNRWIRWLWANHDLDGEILIDELNVSMRWYAMAKVEKQTAVKKDNQPTIELLKTENAALRQQYEEDVKTLYELLQDFRQAKVEDKEPDRPLLGKRILVVGDEAHMPAYRTLIEVLGGECLFSPGFDKYVALDDKYEGADGILFVTAYASHGKYYLLKSHADLRKTVMVNRCGVAAFGNGLKELQQKIG